MAKTGSHWEPTNRADKLKMASDWLSAMNSQPSDQTVINKERWRVTAAMETELTNVVQKIQGLEQQPVSQRTPDSKNELSDAYAELSKQMRDIKRQCFMTPPLTDRDYGTLGLHVPDREPTSIEPPRSVPEVQHSNSGKLKIRLDISHERGVDEHKHADYGCKIKGCIAPRGEVAGAVSPCGITYKTDGAPEHEYQLTWDTFTRKSKIELTFHQDDFEGRFYYAARFENGKGEGGPWSPVTFSVIA